MKKRMLLTLVVVFLIVSAASHGFAQINGAADTSKEGSLLIWPKVQTTDGKETYIIISNNSPNEVCVKCFWEVKDARPDPTSQCLFSDFAMQLSPYTPLFFRASDGSGLDNRSVAGGMGNSEEGALKCWAVSPSGHEQISWNHLSGLAIIVDSDNTAPGVSAPPSSAWEYSAWRFATNVIDSSGNFADGFWVGLVTGVSSDTSNQMNLKASPTTVVSTASCPGPDYSAAGCSLPNAAYDACPKYMSFDFLTEPSTPQLTNGYAFNNLALVPCKTDLTDVTLNLKTKLLYTIWNENNVQYTGTSSCANCAYQIDLGDLATLRDVRNFQYKYLHTPAGRFRVDGTAGTSCGADCQSTPLLGVMSSNLAGSTAIVGTNGSTSGKETTDYGYILWTPPGPYYQSIRRW
jgi:hypothetical protein